MEIPLVARNKKSSSGQLKKKKKRIVHCKGIGEAYGIGEIEQPNANKNLDQSSSEDASSRNSKTLTRATTHAGADCSLLVVALLSMRFH